MKCWRSPSAGRRNDYFGGNELSEGTIFEYTDFLACNQSGGVDFDIFDIVKLSQQRQ